MPNDLREALLTIKRQYGLVGILEALSEAFPQYDRELEDLIMKVQADAASLVGQKG